MISWYMPTWNGDLRVNQIDATSCELILHKPTEAEKAAAIKIIGECREQGWCPAAPDLNKRKVRVLIGGPMAEVGPIASRILRPGDAVLTAVVFKDGHVETSSKSEGPTLEELAYKAIAPYREQGAQESEAKPAEPESETKALATVKRPTPCCPQCQLGAIEPATEALLAFLTPEEHEQWATTRTITVTGGLSGFRYLLAHRHSRMAARIGRVCFDLDNDAVVHFHDLSVPPEEEILAAKLILEHREPWLRNEATLFFGSTDTGLITNLGVPKFKNPFGDGMDGTESAAMAMQIGRMLGAPRW
jgi:hypothetical protein